MRNRFRDPTMRDQYDASINQYRGRHRNLFLVNGKRRQSPDYGSSFAQFFWHGYDGVVFGRGWDAASKRMVGYAMWCAGRDCAANEPLAYDAI